MISLKSKKILILAIAIILFFAGIKIFIYDNPKALYVIAEGLDEPSTSFYWDVERIYSLSRNKSEIYRILNELKTGKNEYLHELYIRTIGIVGGERDLANFVLVKIYSTYQNDNNKSSVVCATIDSMGFIANESTVSILKRLVENFENHRMIVAKYPVVRALYLSTGDISMVRDKSSMDFIATEELKMIRKALVNSKGRFRTDEEILILVNLNRPERFKSIQGTSMNSGGLT